MPTSLLELAPVLLNMIHRSPARRILDVGPGYGKYGLLIREYLDDERIERIDAVELEPRYLGRFPWLVDLYDHLYTGDVAGEYWHRVVEQFGSGTLAAGHPLDAREQLACYDLVLLGDVLEHLDEEDGRALLERIPGRVLVNTPCRFFQNPQAYEGWETERHRSHWLLRDLARIRDVEEDRSMLGATLCMLAPL